MQFNIRFIVAIVVQIGLCKLRHTIISLIEIAIIFNDGVVHEIGCKQAVSRSANEFTLSAFVVLSVMVINRL